MALPGRLRAERDHEFPAAREQQGRALARHAARMFEQAGQADAAQPAASPGLAFAPREAGMVG